MTYRNCFRIYPLFACFFLLAGCDIWNALVDGLAQQKERPRFAFVTEEPIDGTPSENTLVIYSGVVMDNDYALVFERYLPQEMNLLSFRNLTIAPGGQRLAFGFQELFSGGFDDWIHVLSDRLQPEFLASDDIIGSDIRNDCDTSGPEFLGTFGDAIANDVIAGTFPQGTTGLVNWGEGAIVGGGFVGWLASDRFAAMILNNPPSFILVPNEPPIDIGPLGSGEIFVIYEFRAGNWDAIECTLTSPVIPTRPTPLRDLSLSSGGGVLPEGVILLDGNELLSTSNNRISGSYSVIAVDGPLPD